MKHDKRTFEEVLVILFIGICLFMSFYYLLKQPQVESGNIYISGTIQVWSWTNKTKTGENISWNTGTTVRENQNRVIKQTTWTSSRSDSLGEKSVQMMSKDTVVIHKWFASGDYRQELVNYAYKKWGMDLLILMECESWMNPLNVWDGWDAYWLCQMNKRFHDIPNEYYQDRKYQVDYCYTKRLGGTRFYWPDRVIKWQKCSSYVRNRFTILTP